MITLIRNKGLTLEITRIFVHIMPVDRLIESYFVEGIIPFHVEEMCQIAADTFGISLNIVMENELHCKLPIPNMSILACSMKNYSTEVDTIYVGGVNTFPQLLDN